MKQNLNQKTSSGVMMSYGVGRFLAEFLTGAYGIMAFFFYEKEMGLPAIYPTVATIIYSIWNAVNDPLIGWITGKKPVLEKYGKRLFWIVLGLVTCSLAFLLIFMVPQALHAHKVAVFIWMVIAVCLYDAAYSLWEVNYQGVFPDKFRSQDIRRMAAVTSTAFGSVGIVPKEYLRLQRFQSTLRELKRSGWDGRTGQGILTRIAWDNGYCDYAHLYTDFRKISGYSPRQLLSLSENTDDSFGWRM